MIIGFGHKAGSGKDEAGLFLHKNYGFVRIGFADRLKNTVAEMFDLTYDQIFGSEKKVIDPRWNSTPAELLQKFGEAARLAFGPDVWINFVREVIKSNPGTHFVITDVRYPNEAEAIKQMGGVVVRIDRAPALRGDIGRDPNHSSEIALNNYFWWDAIIENNSSIRQFQLSVKEYVDYRLNQEILGKHISQAISAINKESQ